MMRAARTKRAWWHALALAACIVPGAVRAADAEGNAQAAAAATAVQATSERGRASWYGARFQGRRTASGEPFDMHAYTAAHRSLPFGTRVQVTNPANGKTVVVRINDRGPGSLRRLIDLSAAAAKALGLRGRGVQMVQVSIADAEPGDLR